MPSTYRLYGLLACALVSRPAHPPYHQILYYLSSRLETAEVFARKIRAHWSIENRLHWVLDVVFWEDSSPIRQCQPACNISTLKTIGINLLRSLGFLSIVRDRKL